MHDHAKFVFRVMSLVLGGLFFAATCSAQMDSNKDKASTQSVTGCLKSGDEAGGFTIAGDDGKVWELHSKTVKLSDHVGHTITVTGSATKESKSTEEKMGAREKKKAWGRGQGHGKLRA